jgi:hypothetical protein
VLLVLLLVMLLVLLTVPVLMLMRPRCVLRLCLLMLLVSVLVLLLVMLLVLLTVPVLRHQSGTLLRGAGGLTVVRPLHSWGGMLCVS